MKTAKKLVAQILILALVLSAVAVPAFAAAPGAADAEGSIRQEIVSPQILGMQGLGSKSTGVMSIYYPVGYEGTIFVSGGGGPIMTIPVGALGFYIGPLGGLATGTYSLRLVCMIGSVATIVAVGNLVVID